MAKIAVSLYSKNDGGLEESFVYFCNLLHDSGHEVIAFLPYCAPYKSRIYGAVKKIYVAPKGYYDLFSFSRILWVGFSKEVDIFMSFNARSSHYSIMAAKLLKRKSIAYTASYKAERLRKANVLICVTEIMRQSFINEGFNKNKLYTLPPVSADLPKGNYPAKDYSSKKNNIGYLGRMTPEKGFNTFCAAVANVSLKFELKVHIAGNGPEKEAGINELRKNKINITDHGWIKDKDYFFENIQILVVPSISETFGIVILEAMQRGILVVSTPTDGAATILSHQRDGWISESHTARDLAECIEQVFLNRSYWDTVRKNAFEKLQRFGTEATKSKLNIIITSLMLDRPMALEPRDF